MAVIFTELFEGGADGVALTTSNTNFTDFNGSGSAEFDTAIFVEDATSGLFLEPRQAHGLVPVGGEFYLSEYVYFHVESIGNFDFNLALDNDSIQARCQIAADGRFRLLDGGSVVTSTTHVMVPDQWYRIEWTISQASGTQDLLIFTGANLHSTTPIESHVGATYSGSATIDEFTYSRASGAAINMNIDRIILDDAQMPAPLSTDLTSDFDGTSLPPGWTVDSSLGGETITVSDSHVHITVPSGTVYDSISSPTDVDETAGITHDITTADVDVAFQIDTDVSNTEGLGYNVLVFGATNDDACRFTFYQDDTSDPNTFVFGYQRAGGSGASSGNDPLATQDVPWSAAHQWMRVTYDSGTGTWTCFGSVDGVNWTQLQQGTRTFTPERVKVSILSAVGAPGGTIRIQKAVDLLAGGTTDLRDAVPSLSQDTIVQILGTDGALPANVTDDSANSGSVTFTGSAMRMEIDRSVSGTRARLLWTGAEFTNCGLLTQFQFVNQDALAYYVPMLVNQTGNPSDQYVNGVGYTGEIEGDNTRRLLRVDPNDLGSFGVVDANAPYGFLYEDNAGTATDLQWLRIERIGRRVRYRQWLDIDPEPGTWLYDGQDNVLDQLDLGWLLTLSTSDVNAVVTQADVFEFTFYELSAGTVDFAGDADSASDASGTLGAIRALSGDADTASDADADLSRMRGFAGAADTATSADATLSVIRALSGDADAASDADGTLFEEGGNLRPLQPVAGARPLQSDAALRTIQPDV